MIAEIIGVNEISQRTDEMLFCCGHHVPDYASPATRPPSPSFTCAPPNIERLTARRVSENLVALQMELAWSLPGMKVLHRIRSIRMVARPDAGWLVALPLPVESNEFVD